MSIIALTEVAFMKLKKVRKEKNKKILLRERKRHTARRVASTHYAVPVGGTIAPLPSPLPHLDLGRGTPAPCPPGQPDSGTPPAMVDKVKTLPSVILRMRAVKMRSMETAWNSSTGTISSRNVAGAAALHWLLHSDFNNPSYYPEWCDEIWGEFNTSTRVRRLGIKDKAINATVSNLSN